MVETKLGVKSEGIEMDWVRNLETINNNDAYDDLDGENEDNIDNSEMPSGQCI